jgi:hypothetical protein
MHWGGGCVQDFRWSARGRICATGSHKFPCPYHVTVRMELIVSHLKSNFSPANNYKHGHGVKCLGYV